MTLQRYFISFVEDTATGESVPYVEIPDNDKDGIILLDGWLVKLELVIALTATVTASARTMMSVGYKLNPDVDMEWDITNSYNMDDVFEGWTDASSEFMWFHGSRETMPLYYIPWDASYVSVDDKAILTIHFRRPVHAGDQLIFYYTKRSILTTVDNASTGSEHQLIGSFTQVIAPGVWK